ncbi:MAG: tRNA (adenosine(37)-N6)-dimethylallyltransferase MiaA [Alphaproteobacteria bacterium]
MGPTASGKSALALAVAERIGGEIVNADAAQVYRDLRVLSARPSAEDEARAPHHLYGHVDGAERYSVGKWLTAAQAVIADLNKRGKIAIVCGGTGLYFKALTEGLANAPSAGPALRAELLARLKTDGPQSLYAELAQVDPEMAATLGPRDGPRILRALEVWRSTGVSLRSLQAAMVPALAAEDWFGVVLWPERASVYGAINRRFDGMTGEGVEEVRALMTRGLQPDLPVMKAIGVAPLVAHLRGEQSLEKAADKAKQDSRNYAKRQYTWIRGQMKTWRRITADEPDVRFEDAIAALRGVDPAVAEH